MVSFKNVTLSFGDKLILDSFSAELPEGGICCFSGPSGCGKTTLFRLIAGLISPQSGKISSDYKKISFMFQEDRLLPWLSALENVEAVIPAEKKAEAGLLLREFGLGDDLHVRPSKLSGGMRRRVALARALAYGGDLLLLDEPFKGLEPSLIRRLSAFIQKERGTVYVVTHSESEAELLGGRIIRLTGPPLNIVE